MAERPMWEPSQKLIEQANVTAFARQAIRRWKLGLNTYPDFYAWSVDHPEQFWDRCGTACGVIASNKGARVLVDGERMPGARWFPEARLNFAENLLRRRDAADAFVFWDETGFRRRISHAELQAEVSRAAQALRAEGLVAGDRVAAFIPNMPETAVLALAAISIGVVWSSCSPDFGIGRRARPLRPDRAEDAVLRRRLPLQRQSDDSLARVRGDRSAAAERCASVVVVPHLACTLQRLRTPFSRLHPSATAQSQCCDAKLAAPTGSRLCAAARSPSSSCRSTTRYTSCSPRAPPASPNASCTARAGRCSPG